MTLLSIAIIFLAIALFTTAAILYALCNRIDELTDVLGDGIDLLSEILKTWTVDRALACRDAPIAQNETEGRAA